MIPIEQIKTYTCMEQILQTRESTIYIVRTNIY
jgi:hypothetical protein